MIPKIPVFFFGMLAPLLLGGCAIHSVDEDAPLVRVGLSSSFVEPTTGAELPGEWNYSWWESFDDSELNRLIEAGLDSNLNLQRFYARVEQASALARQAGANLYPMLDLDASYNKGFVPNNRIDAGDSDSEERTSIGVTLQWEVDFWGRLSSIRRTERMVFDATVEDWLGARLLLSAAIAETYFEVQEQKLQLDVIQEQMKINKSLQKLTSLRFGQGQSSIVDVLQQQEQLEATRARIPLVEARIGQLEYTLDVLLGGIPDAIEQVPNVVLVSPPKLPAVGIPAQLLTRRPDLRAAQKRVLAFDYEVGIAVANQFPSLSIGGAIDWRGDPSLGDDIQSIFARLAAPLFNAGELRSQVAFRKARLEEALAGYSERYLSALLEVESALLDERKTIERLELVEQQLKTSQRLLNETRNRFSQGLTDYLPVFTALNIVQTLERNVVSARRSVLSARVGLYRAVGGPIQNPQSDYLETAQYE